MAVTWVLIPLLFYYASRGQLWFQFGDANDARIAQLGSTARQHSSLAWGMAVAVMFTVFAISFRLTPKLIDLCRRNWALPSLALLGVLSIAWSQFPFDTFKASGYLVASTLLALYLSIRFGAIGQMKLMYILGWICLVSSIVLSSLFPRWGLDIQLGVYAWRGMYAYKNACAMPTVFLLSVVFYMPLTSLLAKALRAVYVLLSFLLIYMTQSRTGWILLAFLLIYVAASKAIQKIHKKERYVAIAMGAVVTAPIGALLVVYSNQIFYLLGKDPGMTGRTAIWAAVIVSSMKRPLLGFGYNAFFHGSEGESTNVVALTGWNVSASHNGFMDVWVTLGAIGLGLLLYSFFKALKDALICVRGQESAYLSWYGCIAFLMVIVNLDEAAMMLPADLIWVLYIVACVGLSQSARRIRLGLEHA